MQMFPVNRIDHRFVLMEDIKLNIGQNEFRELTTSETNSEMKIRIESIYQSAHQCK